MSLPNEAESMRKNAIKLALEEYKKSGSTRTERITYRGKPRDLPVIRLQPNQLLFNYNNSRLRAQILDDPKCALIKTDPLSDEAQEILAKLLKQTEEYQSLKDEVIAFQQKNAGVVTADGLVIDGNTRLAIIRELNAAGNENAKGIDVAVMPADATTADCIDVEMTRQMLKLTHQQYTFTNELLMIKEYLEAGNTMIQLAAQLGYTKRKEQRVREKLELLSLVEEVRNMTAPPIHYSVFDGKSQHLRDLLEKYKQLATDDLAAANQMKAARIFGMFLGLNKDFTRVINDDFFEEKVIDRLRDEPEVLKLLSDFTVRSDQPSELDSTIFGEPESAGLDARAFVANQLKRLVDEEGFIKENRDEDLNKMAEVFKAIAVDEVRDKNLEDIKLKPIAAMQGIKVGLEDVLVVLDEALRRPDFKRADFEYEFGNVRQTLGEIEQKLKK